MEEHHNGVDSTEELENLVSDRGVLFREFRGDGFMVVGENTIFIIKDHDNNDFVFSEVSADYIQELRTEQEYPSHRIEQQQSKSDISSEVNRKPCTKATLWIKSHAITFYVDATVEKVAASFISFRTE